MGAPNQFGLHSKTLSLLVSFTLRESCRWIQKTQMMCMGERKTSLENNSVGSNKKKSRRGAALGMGGPETRSVEGWLGLGALWGLKLCSS